MITEIAIRRTKTKRWFRSKILPKKRCRCGEAHPACLDFHHKDPKMKKDKVSRLVDCAFNRNIILFEIRKCVVLCKLSSQTSPAKKKASLTPRPIDRTKQ
jgi:hypothetical protein